MATAATVLPASALSRPTTVERAFELARLGAYETLPELAAMLKREGHEAVDAHLAGRSIRQDLHRSWEVGRTALQANQSEGTRR
ncbi:MAG: hypothetical protein QOG84_555 [Sphingomonadales bacterium]|jgi:hypothetical protein|nr:hypothetical protein [Sphingomonadales bacterium]MEA3034286.1 hypothetical protein [Sphingomonadales bacterium]MEA3048719.1 hypothetical protein [Sphingomonadales bacterium]